MDLGWDLLFGTLAVEVDLGRDVFVGTLGNEFIRMNLYFYYIYKMKNEIYREKEKNILY